MKVNESSSKVSVTTYEEKGNFILQFYIEEKNDDGLLSMKPTAQPTFQLRVLVVVLKSLHRH